MTDDRLRSDAQDELRWEPKVDDASIAVSANDGVVTLRGTVGSFREKREATAAVKRVYGTQRVDNQLQVKLLTADRRADADLRADVLQAMILDALIPSTIDAKVDDGVVTLSGTAHLHFERDEAEEVAGNIKGVTFVANQVELIAPPPFADDVKQSIKRAMERDAKLDAEGVRIESADNGTVKLTGSVRSWAEHDAAVGAAWAAPGVKSVHDDLLIAY
ncbi:BON domain-containing protein [Solirubrobacter ginsenosidimutans]|uniref:BON domain-containing protein n=1 Tax=Solirubrobacter ginsenosidimutans TaxID=490573 RepID=A0A9X3MQF2_9ACTN|nr:BON domain-containing protein [Solirubrobacter ginsenosidimutans]MDA0159896.1 BON domain-containing protein [Solirubrobacter ginsenosidimutans]